MTWQDDLLEANERYATAFDLGELPPAPKRRLAILTCMDARIEPLRILGLREGDAHVIRNAGGRVTDDAIRSLVLSYKVLGTREIAVIHHTECGLHRVTNDELRAALREEPGVDASGIDFLPFDDLDESVRDDVELIRSSSLIPDTIGVAGFVYDVRTGRMQPVVIRDA